MYELDLNIPSSFLKFDLYRNHPYFEELLQYCFICFAANEMDVAKEICENLRKIYISDSFMAITGSVAYFGTFNKIYDKNNVLLIRLPPSTGEAVEDDHLNSLVHRSVYESKSIKLSVERAEQIFNHITKMLPGRNKIVLIRDANSDNLDFKLYGSHKGTTEFKYSEFGSPVTVFIY